MEKKNNIFYIGLLLGIVGGIIAKIVQVGLNISPNNSLAIVLTPFFIYYLSIIFHYKGNYDSLRFYRNNIVLNGVMWCIATYIFLLNTTF